MKFKYYKPKYNNLKRTSEILQILGKYGFTFFAEKINIEEVFGKIKIPANSNIMNMSTGERIRCAFEELGTTFIKLGQILSTRSDLLDSDILTELKKLQARNEKNTGIEFIINDKNSYDDFISLLNDMEISKQEHYGIDMDKTGHFFAVHIYKDPNKNEINYYGGDVVYYELPDDYYLKGFQKFQYQLSRLPKEASYLIFGYLILLNVSILSLVRKSI